MTIITIKNTHKRFRKTNFDTVENLFDYLLQQLYFDKNLPELTAKELSEAEQAKKEWKKIPQNFQKFLNKMQVFNCEKVVKIIDKLKLRKQT